MEIGTQLDDAMAKAWPAADVEETGGWILRAAGGVTRRANSVLAVGVPSDFDSAVAEVEHFYRSRGSASIFLVSDASTPESVSAKLADRGYAAEAPTWMVQRQGLLVDRAGADQREWITDVTTTATDRWFDAYLGVETGRRGPASRQLFREVFLLPKAPARFVSLSDAGSVVSVGEVVVVGDWACIQCLATVPGARRRGAGKAVVNQLERLAASLGAQGTFAAVAADNSASLELFESLGYARSHQYRYLVR